MFSYPINQLIAAIGGARVGLATTPASRIEAGRNAEDLIAEECRVTAFLALEHGLRGELQDGVRFASYTDKRTGKPVFSFYGQEEGVPADFFADVDIAVFCVQDVSHRAYTFKQALASLVMGAHRHGKPVIIFDRPTPLAHLGASGPLHRQFFPLPLPVLIPFTLGELALFLEGQLGIDLELKVLAGEGWRRRDIWDTRTCPWIPPSPNIPTLESAYAYVCTGLLQATNLSEGRGTCRPFEFFGAPFVDPLPLMQRLRDYRLPGIEWRELYFKPGFGKYANRVCGGLHMMLTEPDKLEPLRTSLVLLKALAQCLPESFQPTPGLSEWLDGHTRSTSDWARIDVESILSDWSEQSRAFSELMQKYALYVP